MAIKDIRMALTLMKSLQDAKLYMELVHYARTETGRTGQGATRVVLSPKRRRDICSVTGIGLNNLPKHLASLKALGLITGERNDYMISPVIFWRGSNKDRNEFMETDEGRKVVLEFRKVTDDGEYFPLDKQVKTKQE